MAINVLDSVIANRISAGEVVERPASIVKELIDNSIDAKAKSIVIEIRNGGIDYIKVQDDGCGIEEADLKKAFLPHATSKIKTLEDLDSIFTLGFRGEALASIASVCQVRVKTKTENEDLATTLDIEGGEFFDVKKLAGNTGTTMEVKNLFFNTPARRKFLRKPKQEENEITNIVSRYILANPTIKFKYIVDSKPIYTTTGENLLNAIECVYGEETTQNILPIDIRDKNLHLYGFVSKIAFTKPNTTYQTLLVNNRYVVDETVSKAVYIAYEEFLMSRQFPFFVLNLDMPFTDVDVNVNPNKLTIKFSRPSLIFDFIYNNVKKVIYDSFLVKSKNKFNEIKVELPEEISEVDVEGEVIDTPKFFDNKITFKQNFGNNISFFDKSATNSTNYDKLTSILEKNGDITNQKNDILAENLTQVESDKENIEMVAPKAKYESTLFSNFKPVQDSSYQPIVDFSDYKIIGEIFNEFIILEKDEKMLLIDFHAGHERLLFDDFIKKQAEKKIVVQDLLVPYIQTFSAKEIEYILGFKNDFTSLGFDIDQISPYEIRISAVPMLVKDLDLSKFLNDIVNDINNFKPNISYQIDQYLMKMACRSAVKAGQTLNEMQIKALLKGLDINNPVLLCPHGRPIVTVVSKSQIEKWFKRIV